MGAVTATAGIRIAGWSGLAGALLLAVACAAPPRPAPPPVVVIEAPPPDDADQTVRLADACVESGEYREAVRLFTAVAYGTPPSPFQDRALIGLGRLLVKPEQSEQDYWQAYRVFERLARDHPDSPYAQEARAWRELLAVYLSRGEELERRAQELEERAEALERNLTRGQALERRTRELERQLDRRTQELERRAQDLERQLDRRTKELERLKRLDLELEQRRRTP